MLETTGATLVLSSYSKRLSARPTMTATTTTTTTRLDPLEPLGADIVHAGCKLCSSLSAHHNTSFDLSHFISQLNSSQPSLGPSFTTRKCPSSLSSLSLAPASSYCTELCTNNSGPRKYPLLRCDFAMPWPGSPWRTAIPLDTRLSTATLGCNRTILAVSTRVLPMGVLRRRRRSSSH